MSIRSIAAILTLFIVIVPAAFGQANSKPDKAAADFYKWYLHELNAGRFPMARQKQKVGTKVSKRLGRWLNSKAYADYGADYFLSAQDWAEEWEHSVKAATRSQRGNNAVVRVTLGSNSDFDGGTLEVRMIREGGVWKIDRVTRLE